MSRRRRTGFSTIRHLLSDVVTLIRLALTPEKGRELRIGLYRIAGVRDKKRFYAWRPTGRTTFHEPKAFGTLRLR